MSTAFAVIVFLLGWAVTTAGLMALTFPFVLALIVGLILTVCGILVIDLEF